MAKTKTSKSEESGGFSRMLATTIVLGIVFSAGLITGQRLLRAQARAPMVSLSTTRAAGPDASGEQEAKPSLRTTFSFYEHLTGKAEAASPPEETAVDPQSPPADEQPKPTAEEAEEKPESDEPTVEAQAPEAQVPEAKPAEEPDEVAAPPAEEPTAAPEKPMAKILDEVVESLSGESDSAEDAHGDDGALPARYTLQVSSHPDRKSAEREMGRLTNMGVEPHVVVVNVPGKGELFRVRVGKFHTMNEARDFQGSIKSRRGVAGFVTPL